MSASDHRPDPSLGPAHTARLAEAGGHLARIVHELNAPASLLRGSLDNLAEYIIALLHYVAVLQAADRRTEVEGSPVQSDADYAADNAASLLTICRQSVQRLTRLIAELREWTDRPGRPLAVGLVDVHEVVAEAVRLAAGNHGHRVAVERDVPRDTPPVLANADALSQVLTNVVCNAMDAVAGLGLPAVRITVCTTGPGAGGTADRVVELRVRDNGPGIPPGEREQIFQPFFTTKRSGAGLGLGLAIARDLMQRSGGTISLADAAPGAEFVIRLPAAGPLGESSRL